MKSLLPILLLLILSDLLTAQFSLEQFNEERLDHAKKGMIVLGSWAIGNITWGLIAQSNSAGIEKGFHQMNAGWNVVNLGIAGLGFLSARKANAANFTAAESLKEQHKIEKLLLLNSGLDVGYMMAGLYLNERGKNRTREKGLQQQGFGRSLLLQGGFLFAFDLISFFVHHKHGKTLQTEIFGGNEGIGMRLKF